MKKVILQMSSLLYYYVENGGVKVENDQSSMPLLRLLNRDGWLVLCRINDFLLSGYADLEWTHFEPNHFIRLAQSRAHFSCLQRVRDVDFLLIAMLVATSAFGNPPWLGEQLCLFCRLQVVLSEDHNSCCKKT